MKRAILAAAALTACLCACTPPTDVLHDVVPDGLPDATPGVTPDMTPDGEPPLTRSLRVRVTDPAGGATYVRLWWGDGADAEHGTPLQFEPGADGFMELSGLPRGPVVLCALADGFVVPTAGMPRTVVGADETEVILVLDRGTTREVRVLGTSQHATLRAYLAAVEDLEPSHHGVDDDGVLRLDGLRPGTTYNLFLCEPATGRSALLRGLAFEAEWPAIELGQGRDVTGRVLVPEGCDPPVVALLVDRAVMIDGGTAADDGTFTIRGVPDGTYTAVAYTTHGERYLAGNATVAAGGSVTIDLRN